MELIKDTIQAVIRSWDTERKNGRDNPECLLKKILTKKELEHARANYFRHGILSIGVDSSSWLYHLGLKKADLLTKLRKQSQAIKDIRFYIGEADGQEKNKTRKNRRRTG